jgi:hypothetical protein
MECPISGRASVCPGVTTMKRIALGLVAYVMSAGAGLAAKPWKTMDTSAYKAYTDAE